MTLQEKVRALAADPAEMERAYRTARRTGDEEAFIQAIDVVYAEKEENLLLAAWHVRLGYVAARTVHRAVAWAWALPIALLAGLLLWLISDEQRFALQTTNLFSGAAVNASTPLFILLAPVIAACCIVLFLAGAGDRRWIRAAAGLLGLTGLVSYVLLLYLRIGPRLYQNQYLELAALHLALLGWAAIGLYALAGHRDARNRFAFLLKSLDYAVVAGLAGILLMMLFGVTVGLFDAVDIRLPEAVVRLFLAGGSGAIAILAVALVVAPGVPPAEQPFEEGGGRLVSLLLRLLVLPALVVLLSFLLLIPANYRAAFESRDVLIAVNVMLFAVVGLLVGAVPLNDGELDGRQWAWLRRGIVALALLALLVGLYALVAILYRTADDRLTPNRLAFIGWNVINIAALGWLLIGQWRARDGCSVDPLHRSLAAFMAPYAGWALLLLLSVPWLYTLDHRSPALTELPAAIRSLIGEQPAPILIKCGLRPHVYVLEDGQKHWIQDIPTFEAEGFRWRDVNSVGCDDLDAIPDGAPIPPDAGSPPAP